MNEKCEHCGAKINKYWHRLTPVLVNALVKTLKYVQEKDENLVHKTDLDLTHSEYGNYQKLRFHGLIAKHRDEDGRFDGWVITKRAGEFLRGETTVPLKVQTFRNKVVDHSEETVSVRDVIGMVPFVEQEFEREVASPAELVQASLI
jgi:hypothetical protein